MLVWLIRAVENPEDEVMVGGKDVVVESWGNKVTIGHDSFIFAKEAILIHKLLPESLRISGLKSRPSQPTIVIKSTTGMGGEESTIDKEAQASGEDTFKVIPNKTYQPFEDIMWTTDRPHDVRDDPR